jgi:hypothetical protein
MTSVAMTMTLRAKSAAAETAVTNAAILRPSSIRSRPAIRTAIARPDKTHRHDADGGRTHQRQHHASRTFHGTTCVAQKRPGGFRHAAPCEASESGSFHGIVRRNSCQPPPEKCEVKACANEPKPPRVTPPEPELDGEVPDADLFAEESPLVKP